jgi:cysteine-rich repeat protein
MLPSVSNPVRRRYRLLAWSSLALAFLACAVPQAASDKICTPQQYVYCRCADRQEGQKLCRDDGRSYGPCEPCESLEDPVDEKPVIRDPFDAAELPDDGGKEEPDPKYVCGDGIVQEGEDCDDKNKDDSDGCDTECKLSGKAPFKTNACPGLDVHVWGNGHAPMLDATTIASGSRTASPACDGTTTGANAPDRVFHVIAHETGTMKVALSNVNFNVFAWVSDTCNVGTNVQFACVNGSLDAGEATLSFKVKAGSAYYVFIDGAGPTADPLRQGNFRVVFSIL